MLWVPDPGPTPPPAPHSLRPHLTTLHGTAQVAQQTICHSHVVLAHGPVLEAPALAVVVDELCGLAGEEQGFLVVLQGHGGVGVGGHTGWQELPLQVLGLHQPGAHRPHRMFIHSF